MRLGFVLLVHGGLDRSAQLIQHLTERDHPIAVHVDKRSGSSDIELYRKRFSDNPNVTFVPSRRCEWGTWSLVEATQDAAEQLLQRHPEVTHVFLASGSCLPLRPLNELVGFLARHADTDFIESVTVDDVDWTVGGLDIERFTLWFPFGWKTNRRLFDRSVDLQRRLGVRRKLPVGIEPHLGSQWWCLTRNTLEAILNDTRRAEFEKFFGSVWIPDESYFQTLARMHSTRISSRSLTLSKFDDRGKPHVFYDDHLPLLRRSDCFFARKIWPRADQLYRSFLSDLTLPANTAEPAPGMIDRVFVSATHRSKFGRDGLYMAGREPHWYSRATVSAAPFWVFEGLESVFPGFSKWFSELSDARVHAHLFAPDRVEFAGNDALFAGCLTAIPELRDYRPHSFLTNLIWNTRGERQAFHFGPEDRQDVTETIVADPNAVVFAITGAWAIDLFQLQQSGQDVRKEAARLQKIEAAHLSRLRDRWTRARVRIWSLAEAAHDPGDVLSAVVDSVTTAAPVPAATYPQLAPLEGMAGFLQGLRDAGMSPHHAGDFTIDLERETQADASQRPYLVR